MADVSITQVNSFLLKNKKRGDIAQEQLSAYATFIKAWQTDVGKQILGNLVGKYESAIKAMADLTITEEQAAEYKVVKSLLIDCATKVDSYIKLINDIKTNKI